MKATPSSRALMTFSIVPADEVIVFRRVMTPCTLESDRQFFQIREHPEAFVLNDLGVRVT